MPAPPPSFPSARTAEETYEDRPAAPRKRDSPPQPHLMLAIECERPLAGSARYGLANADEVTIGRGGERTAVREVERHTRRLLISVPDRRISTIHARLTWSGEHRAFEDLGSRNGSLVNGERAQRGLLRDGDLLQLGHSIFLLREGLPTPPGTPDDFDFDPSHPTGGAFGFRTLVPALTDELQRLRKVARSNISILLLGETGTGKEVLARAVHEESRAAGPFVAVNCGALPPTLVESQFFGHVKGAFTGAVADTPGLVRAAHGGTLFLDEVGELPMPAQAALLRVLQEREVMPVGSTRAVVVDVRVIAATHRPLDDLTARGTFRSDLFARLAGLTFRLPPLRERREDIGLLIADLLPRFGTVTALEPAAVRALFAHDWPHNVRELEKVLSLASVLAEGGAIEASHIPFAGPTPRDRDVAPLIQVEESAGAAPREEILRLLEAHHGNVTEVARAMGKARQQLHRWLRRLHIDPSLYRRR